MFYQYQSMDSLLVSKCLFVNFDGYDCHNDLMPSSSSCVQHEGSYSLSGKTFHKNCKFFLACAKSHSLNGLRHVQVLMKTIFSLRSLKFDLVEFAP
jgi:hypothetical protein